MLSIGLRYCGGCNPQIDRSRIIKDLKKGLNKMGLKVDLTTDKESAVDIILLINGCMHACLEEEYLSYVNNPQFISVKGEMIDSHYVQVRLYAKVFDQKDCGFFQSMIWPLGFKKLQKLCLFNKLHPWTYSS